MHRKRQRRTGKVGTAELVTYSKSPILPCRIEGCGRLAPNIEQQLCPTHYDRWRRTGDPGGAIRPVSSTAGTCSLPDCGSSIEARGLCAQHYFAAYRQANRDRKNEQGKAWYAANTDLARAASTINARRRRARLRDLPVEPYTLADILERDGTVCVLCGEELDLNTAWPDPLSPTVEHLECIAWPDSAGDVLSNVALSHYTCNCRRSKNPHPAAARKRAELLASGSSEGQTA